MGHRSHESRTEQISLLSLLTPPNDLQPLPSIQRLGRPAHRSGRTARTPPPYVQLLIKPCGAYKLSLYPNICDSRRTREGSADGPRYPGVHVVSLCFLVCLLFRSPVTQAVCYRLVARQLLMYGPFALPRCGSLDALI
jgi:hypothetical protein